jgi:hypothetical protein
LWERSATKRKVLVRTTFLSLYASGIRSISVKSRSEDERERGSDSTSLETAVGVGPTIAIGGTKKEKVNYINKNKTIDIYVLYITSGYGTITRGSVPYFK